MTTTTKRLETNEIKENIIFLFNSTLFILAVYVIMSYLLLDIMHNNVLLALSIAYLIFLKIRTAYKSYNGIHDVNRTQLMTVIVIILIIAIIVGGIMAAFGTINVFTVTSVGMIADLFLETIITLTFSEFERNKLSDDYELEDLDIDELR